MGLDDLTGDGTTPVGTVREDRILPVIDQPANRQLLEDWIDEHESYIRVEREADIRTADFDCLIVDTTALSEVGPALVERTEDEELVLPVILLVESADEQQVRTELRRDHPDLFDAINAIVKMPLAEYQFADRLETLLQMRTQSREIATQRNQLRAIRDEHAGHGVIITDKEGAIEYVNAAFEQQSGYTSSEVLGKNPRILKSGEHDEPFYRDLWETLNAGAVWQGEVINERKDGEQYVLNQTIAPVTDTEGEIYRFIAVNHEITQLKQLEDSLRNQTEQLEVLNRVLRHDIRNDLHIILGWTDILAEHVDEGGQEYLHRIVETGEHIVELTEVAGDLAAEFATDDEPELDPIDVSNVLDGEIEKRQEAFEQAEIELTDELPPDTTVQANTMLASVFRNLINNAVQHSDRPDPTVQIRATVDGAVQVTVADDGPGIPDSQKEAIFSKANKGLDSEGTGMGLYLVQSLIDTYGGAIRVEDNEPRGAVFVVELPLTD